MANPTPVESTPSQAAETWREIESVVEYLARLSKSDLSPREFYAELLGRSVAALAAVGGAVWLCDRDGRLNLEFQTQFDRTGLANNAPELAVHDEVLHSVLPSPTAKAIAPGSGHGSELTNPTPFLMILRPVHAGEGPIGVLEIFQRPDTSPAAQKGYLELVNVVGELAAEFHKNRQLHSLQNRQTTWNRFDDFSQRVHSSLELSQTCYIVANDGRTLVGCDRVSVLIVHGRRCRTAAVSGVDLVDRRANLIRQLENVGRMVASTGDPLVYRGETAGFAPQVEVAVQAYVDESHVRSLTMVPLTPEDDTARRPRPIALLVFERFDSELDED